MHVFVDESSRHGTYLLCAATFRSGEVAKASALVQSLRKPGQRRIHMVKEQDPRQREILSVVASMRTRVRIYHCSGRDVEARAACMWQLLGDLTISTIRTERLILEALEGQDRRDREIIHRCRSVMPVLHSVAYEHMRAFEEPLLAVPDVVAWAYGAAGEWRRRVDPIIEKITELRL